MIRKLSLNCIILLTSSLLLAQNRPNLDSIISMMSHEDMITQLLIIEGAGIIKDSVGGVVLNGQDILSENRKENTGKNHAVLPLVFAYPTDVLMKSINEKTSDFVNVKLLSAVNEPHLLYESGRFIGQECKRLGIDGLVGIKELLTDESWRISELSQGLMDEGVISSDAIRIINATEFDPEQVIPSDKPTMIRVQSDNVLDFMDKWMQALAGNLLAQENMKVLCKQVLMLKYQHSIVRPSGMAIDPGALSEDIARAAITLLANKENLIPVAHLENKKIACVITGAMTDLEFTNYIRKYSQCDFFTIESSASMSEYSGLWSRLANYDLIIEIIYVEGFLTNIRTTENFNIFQRWLNTSGRCITASVGDPEKLRILETVLESPNLMASWEKRYAGLLIPQAIFGGMDVEGVVPVSLNATLEKGFGMVLNSIGRLGYHNPESMNMDKKTLLKIDSLVIFAIRQGAIPGCQVLVAKDNQVVYEKSFGFHTYDSLQKVVDTDLYDMASVTKVSAALPALMLLYEQGKFDLDATLGTYLPDFKKGNKASLTFREFLTHQAGLTAWIPFWQYEMKTNGKFRKRAINIRESKKYSYEIADGLYLKNNFQKRIYKEIESSPVGEKKYLYSDLSFYLYPEIVEKLSGRKYEDFLLDNFYKPLGAETMIYNPLEKYPIDRIVPTEYDSLFRKQQIHGRVHDEGAALMRGVSGHAGLFANANDLAKLWQMYCNYGEYGGRRYLSDSTMREFTRCQFPENNNRRALGFDRPLPVPRQDGNSAVSVSQSSFGHTGFTGNFVWADPEINLVYIFLSNRVYPTRNNTKLYDLNIRTNIQEVIYEAIREGREN